MDELAVDEMQESGCVTEVRSQCVKEVNLLNITFQATPLKLLQQMVSACSNAPVHVATNCPTKLFIVKLHQALQDEQDIIFCELKSLNSRYVLECTTWDDQQYTSITQLKEAIGNRKIIFQTSLMDVDLITVLNKTFDNLPNVVHCYNDVSFAQLSAESQKHILSRNIINFRGNLCSFLKILGDDSEYDLDIGTLCELMTEEPITIGELPHTSAELPEAYSSSYQIIPVERFINLICEEKKSFIFVVSGKENVTEELLSLCTENQLLINNHLYDKCDSQSKGNIGIFEENTQDPLMDQKTFRNICKRSDKVTFWIKIQEKSLILHQVYDPFFYKQRKFHYVESVQVNTPKMKEMLSCQNVAFIISCVPNIETFSNMFDLDLGELKEGIQNGNVIIIKDKVGEQQFHDSCKKFSQVYWLEVEDNKILWVQSQGPLDLLRESSQFFYDMRTYHEEEFASKLKRSLVILSGDAGIGKSTTLASMSINLMKSHQWVIGIDFSETCIKNGFETLCKTSMGEDDILKFICDMDHLNIKNPIAVKLLKYYFWKVSNKDNKIVFILDGIDELYPEIQSKVREFTQSVKYKTIYIASRQDPRIFEDQYSVLTTRFELIYQDEQRMFLTKYWSNHLVFSSTSGNIYKDKKLHGTSKKVLSRIDDLTKNDNTDLYGNPLYLILLSELSLPYIKEDRIEDFLNKNLDVNMFFENIFKTKLEICSKERKPHISIDSAEFITMIDEFNFTLAKLAVKYLFPKYLNVEITINEEKLFNDFVLAGILQSDKSSCGYKFTHRVFCEYYCAYFIVKCLQKQSGYSDVYDGVIGVVNKELFMAKDRDPYKMLKIFKDCMLSTDLPLHKAIINRDYDTLMKLMEDKEIQPTVDSLGRSALHYAAQYGDEQILFTLINAKWDGFQRDVTGRTPIHYATRYSQSDNTKYLTVPYIDITEDNSDKTTLSKLINLEDARGCSSLYYAADSGEWDLCIWLIIHGASCRNLSDTHKSEILKKIIKMSASLSDLLHDVVMPLIDGVRQISSVIKECNLEAFLNVVLSSRHLPSIKTVLKLLQKDSIHIGKELIEDKFHHFSGWSGYLADVDHLYICQYLFKSCYANIKDISEFPASEYLINAARIGHLEVFKYIVRFAENMYTWVTYFEGVSFYKCIKTAIKYNHNNVVEYIWDTYRDLIVDESGNTPLILAARYGNMDLVKYLLENGGEVSVGNKEGKGPLHFAAEERRLEVMKYLVAKGGDVNATDSTGNTVLDYARRNNLYENLFYLEEEFFCVKYLVLDCNANSAEFNKFNKTHVELILRVNYETVNVPVDGTTLLHMAVEMECETFVRYLLYLGADPNARNSDNKTPLECMKNPSPISHILFQHGARFVSSTQHHLSKSHCFHRNNGEIPVKDTSALGMLHYGMRHGLVNSYYFEKDCYNCNYQKELAMNSSITSPPITNISDLFEKLKNVIHHDYNYDVHKFINDQYPVAYLINAVDSKGQSLTHWVAQTGDIESLRMIIDLDGFFAFRDNEIYELQGYKESKSISLQDDNGDSPLHIGARYDHPDIVTSLLQTGAMYDSLNKNGETPAQCCTCSEVITIFQKISTFFLLVNQNSYEEVDKILFTDNYYVYVRDKLGRTALHLAVKNNHLKIVQLLLNRGAVVDATDNDNRTPLHYAAEIGAPDLMRELLMHGAVFNSQDKDGRTPSELCEDGTSKPYFDCITQIFTCVQTANENDVMKLIGDIEGRDSITSALINTRDRRGNSLLHYAASRGYLQTVHFILKNGGMYNTFNTVSQSPIDKSYNHLNVFHLLDVIEYLYTRENVHFCYPEGLLKKDPAMRLSVSNSRHVNGDVLLHRVGDVYLAKWLVKYSTKTLDSTDYKGRTPLMRAVESRKRFIIKILCEGGADINKQDYNGDNALHMAVGMTTFCLDIVKYLVEQGADVTIRNRDGCTPVDLARKLSIANILCYLQKIP